MKKVIIYALLLSATVVLSVKVYTDLQRVGEKLKPNAGVIPAYQVVKMESA